MTRKLLGCYVALFLAVIAYAVLLNVAFRTDTETLRIDVERSTLAECEQMGGELITLSRFDTIGTCEDVDH